jgi:hypothetical protein
MSNRYLFILNLGLNLFGYNIIVFYTSTVHGVKLSEIYVITLDVNVYLLVLLV